MGLDCSANQPVAKLIWHVDNIGWSGGDNVTSLRFPARDVLAALGGGAVQHVTARCSAVDGNGTELANHDTTVTVYDPQHPDLIEPGSGAPAYVIPQALVAKTEALPWEQSCAGGSFRGVIDTVPLQAAEEWRQPGSLTAAMVSGAPPKLNELGYALDPHGIQYAHYCVSSLQPEPFPCPLVAAMGTGFGMCGAVGVDYAGDYLLGIKLSRTNPLGPGYTTTERVQLHYTVVDLRDSKLGENYSVGSTEWALLRVKLADKEYQRPYDAFAADGIYRSGNFFPYNFFLGEEIGDNGDNLIAATEFSAGEQASIPLIELLKRLVDSKINGRWITLEEIKQNYRILALYQSQGEIPIDAWATTQSSDGELRVSAQRPGRAVLFIVVESKNGAINEHAITFSFK